MNQISLEGAEDQYDEVLSRLQEEEEKVNADLQKNALVLPNIIKKGTINLQVDKRILKSFKDDRDTNNFSFYLSQRRQSSQSIESAMTQCSQFATYCKSKYSELKDIYTPMQLFHDISTKYPTLCHQYFDYLHKSNIKASSILGRIDTLILLFDWIRINSNDINVYKDMNERLKIDRKTYQFMEKRYTKSQTIDVMIDRREWVPGGMKELMEMMIDSFAYFDSLIAFSCYQPLTCHQYSWALGYALASMWVMAYNSRCGAIEIMTLKDYQSIEQENFHLANKFKTSAAYSYQIVKTTDVVNLYVKYLRRHVIPPDVDSDEAALFPSWKGTPLSQGEASKKVSNIFRRYGFNLSVTRLRGIISTHVEERFRSNEITMEEYQRFITTGQTHTIATHNKFYAKKRKYEEGKLIQESYERIFPAAPKIHDYYNHDPPDNLTDSQQQIDQYSASEYYFDEDTPPIIPPLPPPVTSRRQTRVDDLREIVEAPIPHLLSLPLTLPPSSSTSFRSRDGERREFGKARSDVGENKKKYDWIEEEIDYLVEYIRNIAPQLPGASKNRYAACLSFLKQSAPGEAIQFFHPHHLMSSDRLKNGYLRAMQKIEEGDCDGDSDNN